MRNIFTLFFTILFLGAANLAQAQSCGVSAVYGGGPFYKTPATSIPELRTSGFTTAVIWTIHIDASGNFNYNAEFPLVANGVYIGYQTHPDFSHNVALLKTQPTSIRRIEAGLSAAGGGTFQNIKNLIAASGTGPTTNLYKNFKALKDSIPGIDALNFDDESTYDVVSSVQFAVMLSGLGYKVTLCPYTSATYWKNVASQTNTQAPGTVDAIFLQCYDGGANNTPCIPTWDFGSVPVYPGLWDNNSTPAAVQTKMTAWKTQCNIKGGFMWLYDDFKNTVKTQQYAAAINAAIGIGAPTQATAVSPANAASSVSLQPALSWTPSTCAQSHDLYFGTTNPPALIGNRTTTTYNPATLQPHTTYYWRVDEKNYFGTTTGAVWSFTTLNPSGVAGLDAGVQVSDVYPNPFTSNAGIDVTVTAKTMVTLSVVDIYGHEVYTTMSTPVMPSKHTFTWNGTNQQGGQVAAGIYLLRMSTIDGQGRPSVANRRAVLVK